MSRVAPFRWQEHPGSFDVIRNHRIYPADPNCPFSIPALAPYDGQPPEQLIAWTDRIRSDRKLAGAARHFFLDDYRFECVWKAPSRYDYRVLECAAVLTPDFSLLVDQPEATQIWNTFRNRWLGAYWQSMGVEVIPTVTWSDQRSYGFCFSGLPNHGTVAVSTVGCVRAADTRRLFMEGFSELVRRVQPQLVLVYGKLLPGMEELALMRSYPTRWQSKSYPLNRPTGNPPQPQIRQTLTIIGRACSL